MKTETQKHLGQYFTPTWAAELILEHFYPNLDSNEVVVDPTCGDGRFLMALDDSVSGYGVEIDPYWAEQARINTGRKIITGDITEVEFPEPPTLILGNPPYKSSLIDALLMKGYQSMEYGGRIGLLLPVYFFQTASTVMRHAERFSITQTLIPRNIFKGLEKPILWAEFQKTERRVLTGFFLYEETYAVSQLHKDYRYLFIGNDTRASLWGEVVELSLRRLGGEASLQDIYAEVEGNQPTANPFWRAQIRKVLYKHFVRIGDARFGLNMKANFSEIEQSNCQLKLAV